jgi:hypothetical protein
LELLSIDNDSQCCEWKTIVIPEKFSPAMTPKPSIEMFHAAFHRYYESNRELADVCNMLHSRAIQHRKAYAESLAADPAAI